MSNLNTNHVYNIICDSKTPLTSGEIAQILNKKKHDGYALWTPQDISRHVSKLKRSGLVSAQYCPGKHSRSYSLIKIPPGEIKMKILLDMDGVMCDLSGHICKLLNRYHGENLKPKDIKEWDISAACKNATQDDIYKFFNEPGFFRHLDPMPGAIDVVSDLFEDGHEIIFVTSTGFTGHSCKLAWLERHLPKKMLKNKFVFNHVVFTFRKDLVRGDILLDDKIKNLNAFKNASPDQIAVCFSHPYNKKWNGPTVANWDSFYNYVHNIKKERAKNAASR